MHQAESEEGCALDRLLGGEGLLGIRARNLDQNTVPIRLRDNRLVRAQGVDALAKNFEGEVIGVRHQLLGFVLCLCLNAGELFGRCLGGVDLLSNEALRLQVLDELRLVDLNGEARAALEVQPQAHLLLHRERYPAREGNQHRQNRPLDQARRIHLFEVQHDALQFLL